MYRPYKDFAMLHGMYIKPNTDTGFPGGLIAAVKNITTGEKKLHIIYDPDYEVWLTKPALRRQENRLECESINNLSCFHCKYRDLWKAVASGLGEYYHPAKLYEFKSNPHVYGTDVGPLVRMKIEYMQACNGVIPKLDIGMLDIETGVIDAFSEVILCASYTDWSTRVTYEFINAEWCNAAESEFANRMDKELKPFLDGLNNKARKVWDRQQHTFKYIHCANEKELIIRLIRTTLECKPDLCGIWNMAYDIPRIEKRALWNQLDTAYLFCHQDVPTDLVSFAWHPDTSQQVEHFTDVWHQVEAPGYTRWYDPMCTYSRLRKVQGRENFYNLEYISSKIIGSGKMKFGVNDSHSAMQLHDQVGYCVYNCFDTILPCVMDDVTGDTSSMMVLTDISELSEFSKQTVMLKNQWYNYCRYTINSIPGCVPVGNSLEQDWDKFLANIGGAVLNPNLLENKGSKHLLESDAPTALHILTNDIDATSLYPSICMAMNISRETKYATALWIEGCPHTLNEIHSQWQQVQELKKQKAAHKELGPAESKLKAMVLENTHYLDDIFGKVVTPVENAEDLCASLFGLPNFTEMRQLYKEFKNVNN